MIESAIIGLGWWGGTITRCLKESKKLKIIAGVDIDERHGKAFANEYGITFHNHINGVLEDPEIKALMMKWMKSDPKGMLKMMKKFMNKDNKLFRELMDWVKDNLKKSNHDGKTPETNEATGDSSNSREESLDCISNKYG